MPDDNKVKPEEVIGTIPLPSRAPIEIDKNAVGNNKSTQTSEDFVRALEKAAKENVFSPSPSASTSQSQSSSISASPSPSEEAKEEDEGQ